MRQKNVILNNLQQQFMQRRHRIKEALAMRDGNVANVKNPNCEVLGDPNWARSNDCFSEMRARKNDVVKKEKSQNCKLSENNASSIEEKQQMIVRKGGLKRLKEIKTVMN